MGESVIGSIGEIEVNDDASVSPPKEYVNSDGVVEEPGASDTWVIAETEGTNWASHKLTPRRRDEGEYSELRSVFTVSLC